MLAAHRIALEPVLIFVNVFLETFIIVFKLTSFATLSSRGAPYIKIQFENPILIFDLLFPPINSIN